MSLYKHVMFLIFTLSYLKPKYVFIRVPVWVVDHCVGWFGSDKILGISVAAS